jgi:hypothetical protein
VIYFFLWLFAERARLIGFTSVAVRCESCGRKYYYRLERIGRGEGNTKQQASRTAERHLLKSLDNGIDAVPCPHCGWFQKEMIPLLREPRLRWMMWLGVVGALINGFPFVLLLTFYLGGYPGQSDGPSLQTVIILGAGFLTSIALLASRAMLNRLYDPNDPATELDRIEVGRGRSLTREEAEKLRDYVIRRA